MIHITFYEKSGNNLVLKELNLIQADCLCKVLEVIPNG